MLINVQATLQTLKKNGYAIVEDAFSLQLQSVVEEFDNIFSNIEDTVQASMNEPNVIRYEKPGSYSPGKHLCVYKGAYARIPKIVSLSTHPAIQQIVLGYCGKNVDYMNQIFMSQEYNPCLKRDMWARNNWLHWDPYPALKVFYYLSDTTKKNGATHIVPGSRKIGRKYRLNMPLNSKSGWNAGTPNRIEDWSDNPEFSNDDAVSLDVKSGTILFFDTDMLHHGGLITELNQDRKVIIVHNRPFNLNMPMYDEEKI